MRVLLIALALLASGCETAKLWREPQAEYVKIVPHSPDEDVELVLKGSPREYYCKQFYHSSYANDKVCYVKVTAEEKFDNVGIKLLKTPEKLVIDAGKTVYVIGYAAVSIAFGGKLHN